MNRVLANLVLLIRQKGRFLHFIKLTIIMLFENNVNVILILAVLYQKFSFKEWKFRYDSALVIVSNFIIFIRLT